MIRPLCTGVLLVTLLPMAAVCAEQSPDEAAKARYTAGLEALERQRYDAALAEFEAAYALTPYVGLLYAIADCQDRMGRVEAAVASYERYLQLAPATARRAQVEERLRRLRPPSAPPLPAARVAGEAAPRPRSAAPETMTAAPRPIAAAPGPVAAGEPRRLVTRPWFWGVVVGGAAVLAVGVGLGVAYGTSYRDPVPSFGMVPGQ